MNERIITGEHLIHFKEYLIHEERSVHTIEKYTRDVQRFMNYMNESSVTKEMMMQYKKYLLDSNYCYSSINSMLSSINSFLSYLGWDECKVKTLKIQRQIYAPESKELSKKEYVSLVNEAKRLNNDRLSLIIQTLCTTGIRISELKYITVEAVQKSEVMVSCKGKIRTVFLVQKLKQKLIRYINKHHIHSGSVFVTKTGNPISRCNVWKELKKLCRSAQVESSKVFPHNFRHLFARTFYSIEKDIAKLADVLGHSSINTTRIYIISTGSEHKRLIEQMKLIL